MAEKVWRLSHIVAGESALIEDDVSNPDDSDSGQAPGPLTSMRKTDEHHTSISLTFVAETGKTRPGGPERTIIRSHVARKALKPGRPQKQVHIKPADGAKGKVKLRTQSASPATDRRASGSVPLGCRPGDKVLDPFTIFPIGGAGSAKQLVRHYNDVYSHTFLALYPRGSWVRLAVSENSQAHLHVLLCSTASHLALIAGRASAPDCIYHQGEAIRLIKKELYNNPISKVRVTTIVAIAILVLIEAHLAAVEPVKIHLDGLEKIIKLKGGLKSVEQENSDLVRTVTWADSIASIVLEVEPRFQPLHTIVNSLIDDHHHNAHSRRYKFKLTNLTGDSVRSDEAVDIYINTRRLFKVKENAAASSNDPDSDIEMQHYSFRVEQLERQLFQLTRPPASRECNPASNESKYSIFKVFGNAGLVHSFVFMRDVPRGVPLLKLISSRIRRDLESENLQMLEFQYPEMMLWVILMGGIGGIGSTGRKWFASLMAEACESMGIRGLDELASTLEDFLWSELYCSPVTRGFWDDVAAAQGVDKGYEVRSLKDYVSTAPFRAPPDLV